MPKRTKLIPYLRTESLKIPRHIPIWPIYGSAPPPPPRGLVYWTWMVLPHTTSSVVLEVHSTFKIGDFRGSTIIHMDFTFFALVTRIESVTARVVAAQIISSWQEKLICVRFKFLARDMRLMCKALELAGILHVVTIMREKSS